MKQYLYENESAKGLLEMLENDYKKTSLPGFTVVENGVILPRREDGKTWGMGGVIDVSGKLVPFSKDESFGGEYSFDEEELKCYEEEVIYLGYTIEHWGTFLFDLFRRCYLYCKEDFAKRHVKLAFCGIGFKEKTFGKIHNNCLELFQLLGVSENDLIDIRVPSRFQKVYVAEPGYDFAKYYYGEFTLPYHRIREQVLTDSSEVKERPSKIYLTRTQFKPRKESGEKQIERFFHRNGFEIISMEKLSVTEQIRVIASAQIVVSIEGTVAHNILFACPGTTQVIIRKQSELNPRQPIFNQASETNAIYIDCYYEPFQSFPVSHDDGPFLILFNRQMKKFAKDNEMKFGKNICLYNFCAILDYVFRCFYVKVLEKLVIPIYKILSRKK